MRKTRVTYSFLWTRSVRYLLFDLGGTSPLPVVRPLVSLLSVGPFLVLFRLPWTASRAHPDKRHDLRGRWWQSVIYPGVPVSDPEEEEGRRFFLQPSPCLIHLHNVIPSGVNPPPVVRHTTLGPPVCYPCCILFLDLNSVEVRSPFIPFSEFVKGLLLWVFRSPMSFSTNVGNL